MTTRGQLPRPRSQFLESPIMLAVTVKNSGDGVVLQCNGRIVRGDETAILCAAVRQEGRNVTLDLAGVDAIDAAGIGCLVSLQASGIYLTLLNPTEPVREVFRVTQLESVFEIRESRALEESLEESLMAARCAAPARASI
jgi:anti-anti-sigma factor